MSAKFCDIDVMKTQLSTDFALSTQHIHHNLTKCELNALTKLKNNKDIVINQGDKGSSIVIQNRWDYIKNNEDHLQDPLTYTQLEGDPTGHLCEQNTSCSNQTASLLTRCSISACHPLARFYSLLKVHKNPMKIRPIVSSCNNPTENISQF